MTITAPTFHQLITSLAQAGYSFEHILRSPFRDGGVWTVEVVK